MKLALLIISGLGILTIGADILIRGATALADRFGVSALVIGLTVVAFGTSAPELAVSVHSAWQGKPDIALGNVVGSNIFNILLILGCCAVIAPLRVHSQLVRFDVPLMIGTSVLFLLFALDHSISMIDGIGLVSLLVCYTIFSIRTGRKESAATKKEFEADLGLLTKKPIWISIGAIILGLACLVFGADLFVGGAVELAKQFGLSELVIGLTIIAGGTSLPEVATSIVATLKGERDVAIGNVIGSCIFNILSVLGLAAIVSPIQISPAALSFDIPVMIGVSAVCLPIFYTNYTITRANGFIFLFFYAAYTTYLVLDASSHSLFPIYSEVLVAFLIPLALATAFGLGGWHWSKKRTRTR